MPGIQKINGQNFGHIYNAQQKHLGEQCSGVSHSRTGQRLDIWYYIRSNEIPIVPLYFAKVRPVVKQNNQLIMVDDARLRIKPTELVENKRVRFRTLGCYPLTAAIESSATTVDEGISELESMREASAREGRLIDHDQIGAMERKKQEGYF